MFGRDKKTKLIHQQLARRGLLKPWWPTAEAAIRQCETGDPCEPLLTGGGPCPARSVVALLALERFVEGGVDWSIHDDLTDPGGWFYPPNNDVSPKPGDAEAIALLQNWFFPTGEDDDNVRWVDSRLMNKPDS